MNDQRARCALPRGFLILVGPAAVIGHPLALKEARLILGGIVRIVDQNYRDLALHVDPGIVIPAQFGRNDTVADEDQRRVLQFGFRRDPVRSGDEILAKVKMHRLAHHVDMQSVRILRFDLNRRHVLHPAALVARLQPGSLEAFDDEGDRLVLTSRGRPAPFIGIGRQLLGHRLQRFGRDHRRGDLRERDRPALCAAGRNPGGQRHSGAQRDNRNECGASELHRAIPLCWRSDSALSGKAPAAAQEQRDEQLDCGSAKRHRKTR